MKGKFLIVLFLLGFCCVGSVSAQQAEAPKIQKITLVPSELSPSELKTDVIQLKNIKLKAVPQSPQSCVPTFDENTGKFLKLFVNLLSSRGGVEIDLRRNSLIITDLKDRVKLLSDFAELLDNAGFTLEELLSKTNIENK
jgi:type II secretory pathway component HofQ